MLPIPPPVKEKTLTSGFAAPQETFDKLNEIQEHTGCNRSETIRQLVDAAYEALQEARK